MSTLIRPNRMSFMYLLTTHGWFTGIPLRHGRDGIRILESGLAGRIFRLDSVLESAGSAVLDGDGAIGDSTGTTITRSITTAGTTRGAERFTTATIITVEAWRGVELTALAGEPMAHAAEFTTVPAQVPDRSAYARLRAKRSTLGRVQRLRSRRRVQGLFIARTGERWWW